MQGNFNFNLNNNQFVKLFKYETFPLCKAFNYRIFLVAQ